jgi:diguanylate cyclase (GGDEF)-like protein
MAFDIQGYHEKYKDLYGDVPLDEVAKDAFTRGGYDKEYPDYDTWKKATGIEGDIQTDLKKRTPKTWEDKLSEGVANVTPGFIPKDISTSFVKGATLNYVPSVETPADAGILRKGAVGAAHLAGMSVPIGIAALALPEAATVGGVILTSGALGGLYGLLRKPEEGEDRLSNAAKDAAMFATFGVGGKVIGAGLKKLFPETVGKVFEKIVAKQELTPGEKAIYSASQYGSSATLGMGAGATESADTWEQRLQNIAVGGITFAGAHGISSNLMKLVREGKATPDQLEYIKKLEAGANTSTIIDEGLKTGKIGEEVFTPNHALDLIKTANDSGVYSTEDVAKLKDRYENKYPALKQGLNNILKDSIKNEISFGIDVGLKAGRLRGREFTPDDALEVIKDGREKGIYTDADIDSFRDKYPALKQGLNDIVVDSAINKVNEALKISRPAIEEGKQLNKIIPKRNIETDVPLKLGEPVDEIIKTKVSREIIDLQTNIAKREKYLAGNKAFEGTDMYKKNITVLEQDKAKLAELTKPAEAITPPTANVDGQKEIKYVWQANKEGGQTIGNKEIIRTPTLDDFEKEILPRTREGYYGDGTAEEQYEQMLKKEPEIKISFIDKGNGWEVGQIRDLSQLVAERKQSLDKGWAKQVDDFESPEAKTHRETFDIEPIAKEKPNASPIKTNAKEPWEMTREEYKKQATDHYGEGTEESIKAVEQYHKQQITYALEFGKPVPPEVMKDYPQLVSKGEPGAKLKTATKTTKEKGTALGKGAQNLVTKVKELGGWNPGSDYNTKLLRQDPDSKRVLNLKNGLTSDQIASILQADGWSIDSGDHVAELLKSGQGRKVFPPDKADVLNDREVKRQEKEWADAKDAEYDAISKEYSDAKERGELPEVEKRLKNDIESEIKEEGYNSEAAAAEVKDFFTAIAEARQLDNNRRANYPNRKSVSEMTPDERATALLTDHLTGQKNKRAYEEAERKPYQASLDVDGLKYVNDTFGHDAGNELLKTVGETLNRASEGKDNYHFHGDEFVLEGKTPAELTAVIEKAKQILKDEPLEFNGQKYTADFSHGIAETMAKADKEMQANKAERKVTRGEKPIEKQAEEIKTTVAAEKQPIPEEKKTPPAEKPLVQIQEKPKPKEITIDMLPPGAEVDVYRIYNGVKTKVKVSAEEGFKELEHNKTVKDKLNALLECLAS